MNEFQIKCISFLPVYFKSASRSPSLQGFGPVYPTNVVSSISGYERTKIGW